MEQLEKVSSFQEFVQIFSQFGNEMVEFAHLTGDRQNVSTDEKLQGLFQVIVTFGSIQQWCLGSFFKGKMIVV